MREQYGLITWETLREYPFNSNEFDKLARFIPEAGLWAREFIHLPIDDVLDDIRFNLCGQPYREDTIQDPGLLILFTHGILPERTLHKFALRAVRKTIPFIRAQFPDEERFELALDIKARRLKSG